MRPHRNEIVDRDELKRLLGLGGFDRVDHSVLVNAIAQLEVARDLVGARLSDVLREDYEMSRKEDGGEDRP